MYVYAFTRFFLILNAYQQLYEQPFTTVFTNTFTKHDRSRPLRYHASVLKVFITVFPKVFAKVFSMLFRKDIRERCS